jgi:hypothetical protein
MEYAVKVALGGMIYIPRFFTINFRGCSVGITGGMD